MGTDTCARLARLAAITCVAALALALVFVPQAPVERIVQAPAPQCGVDAVKGAPPTQFAIVSLVGEAFLSAWQLSLRAKSRYAARHGYHHIVEVPRPSSFAEIMWQKPSTIARYLPYYEWVFFVDADSYIVNVSLPLTRLVSPDAHVVVADEDGPPLLAGLIMVRNSREGHEFMTRWWDQLKRVAGESWLDYDNGAFLQTVLETVAPASARSETEECFKHALAGSYGPFSSCAKGVLDRHAGPFGARRNKIVRFLPPSLTVGRFCERDMTERSKAEVYVPQVRPYRIYHPGDFMVHCKMQPPTNASNPWLQLIDKQFETLPRRNLIQK